MIRRNISNTLLTKQQQSIHLDISHQPKEYWANYADIFISNLNRDFSFNIIIKNGWYTFRYYSEDQYTLWGDYNINNVDYLAQLSLVSSNHKSDLPYQLEFQGFTDNKLHLRIYHLKMVPALSLKIYIESNLNENFDLEIKTAYDTSIVPKEPNFIYGERRYYNSIESTSNTFNNLKSIENCSPLVEETILQSYQEEWMFQPKAIKVSKKYYALKINHGYHLISYQNTPSSIYGVLSIPMFFYLSDVDIIANNNPNEAAPFMSFGLNSNGIPTQNDHSLPVRSEEILIESFLKYDGEDDFYHYFHLIENNVNGHDDNMIEIIGVNSRKKNFS